MNFMKNRLKILNVLTILTVLVISLSLIISACSSGLIQSNNKQSGNENIESVENSNQGNSGGNNAVSDSESSVEQEGSGESVDGSNDNAVDNGNKSTESIAAESTTTEGTVIEGTVIESTNTENNQQTKEEVLEKPSVKLNIIQGPEYAQDGTICYYRVKAEVTGNPTPQIIFSKDDSNGTWGSNVAQINLTQDETYKLVSEVKNSEGSGTSSITLQWVAPDNTSINNGETSIDYSNPGNFRIDVNLTAQLVSVYYKDNLIKSMRCSGGKAETPTVTGTFITNQKIYYSWVPKFNEGAYYWVRFYGAYLFHSVPFDKNGNIIAEEASKIGTPASHGCIRLALEDAKWFYETIPLGIKVIIHY